jgi:hypothetical protein
VSTKIQINFIRVFHQGVTYNGRGFTQGGEGYFLLLAWPLLTRLAKAKLLKLIETPMLMGHC